MNDMGPLPVEHPRERAVQRAKIALLGAMIKLQEEHELTSAELLFLLADHARFILSGCIAGERKR